MSELPKGWVETDFETVLSSISNGIADKQNKDNLGIPVSRIETISFESVNYSRIGYVDTLDEKKSDKYLLVRGDILFSHINSPIHLGKTAIFDGLKKLYHGTNLLRIVTNRDICQSEYFNYFCKYTRATGAFSLNAQHAVNQSSLNQQKIKSFKIQLAPQAEQTRIVEKLDEVLAQVDTIKARLEGIPAILKRFRQSVLAAAVSGRLTEEWRKTNFREVDLELILKDVSISRKNKEFRPPKGLIEIDETPFEIPTGWLWVRLGAICLKITDGAHNTPHVLDKGFPYLMAKDLTGGTLNFSQQQYISEKDHAELFKKCNPELGDLLVVNIGAGTGNNVLVDVDFEFSFKNIAILKRSNAIIPTYLKFYFDSQKKRIFDEQTRGGAQPFLSLTILNNILIALPSIDEQEEISRLVNEYFSFINTIETQVKKAQSRVDNLTQSILAKAFRGELVPQDPSDEPAEKLLERIAQARKEAEALAKAAKKVAKTK